MFCGEFFFEINILVGFIDYIWLVVFEYIVDLIKLEVEGFFKLKVYIIKIDVMNGEWVFKRQICGLNVIFFEFSNVLLMFMFKMKNSSNLKVRVLMF